MKRVLVTGASGFIGSECLPFLAERGYEIHAFGRGSAADGARPLARPLHYHQCDLLYQDCHALLTEIRPTHLLHFSWYAEHGKFWEAPENREWPAASLRLVRAFAAAGGIRAVFAGSCAEYDWSFETLDEATTPLQPATLYGASKLELFKQLQSARGQLAVSMAWGRIFFPYGPHDQPGKLLSAVIDGVRAGREVACSNGRQVRPFIYVEDVARAFVDLLGSEVTGAVNIATDEVTSVRDMVAQAARLCGDESLVRFGAKPLQQGEPPLLRAATRRLFDEVGFRPRFSVSAGVARTAQLRT
jgi:nucleoside-diphosphate-sugar epimerase